MPLNKDDFEDLRVYELICNISLYFEHIDSEIISKYLE